MIENKEYDVEHLSDEAKAQLTNLKFIDVELARLHAQVAVMQTARIAYFKELQKAISGSLDSEKIKFS